MHPFFLKTLFFFLVTQAFSALCCLESEREALLKLKADVDDPSNRLASWKGGKCCNWAGVKCNNNTGHIIMLNLRNSYIRFLPNGDPDNEWNYNHMLSGKISPSLQHMSELEHLDLSCNYFSGEFPRFIDSFRNLNYLNLSSTGLSGLVPPQLGNLSKLQYLDLSDMDHVYVSNVWWLSHLTSLTYLNMIGVDFQDSREWVQALNTLPLLQSLYLASNNLNTIPTSITWLNFSSLEILFITENEFNSQIPDWIGKLTTLTELRLISCSFIGPIPNQLGNLVSLNTLDLRQNYLEVPMPPLLSLKNLAELWISDVSIEEDITEFVSKLANDTLHKLRVLSLVNTNLSGNLTGWMSKIPNLKFLDLSYNYLNGTIPTAIGNLKSLEQLILSGNSFSGEVSEAHLVGLSNLKALALDSNNVTIRVSTDWVPPFQLHELDLYHCKIGPYFPSWLQNQSQMTNIDISNTGIVDTVPNWFWNWPNLYNIDASHNHMTGRLPLSLEHLTMLDTLLLNDNQFDGGIPSLPRSIGYVDLSNNLFSSQVPTYIEAPDLQILILSNNSLNGTIEKLTCGLNHLLVLNLEENNLSGNLPRCWPSKLWAVNLAHNNLSGTIPSSIGSLNSLEVLQLNNNSLIGKLPSALQFCGDLKILDIGENKISGQIPKWIGEGLNKLKILRLRSNKLSGIIPDQIMHLTNLQVLDLASNNISGFIPQNLERLKAMASPADNKNNPAYQNIITKGVYYSISISMVTKGLKLEEHSTTLSLIRSIDLSSNNITGEIPEQITKLRELINLNLSKNHLSGPIPTRIGDIQSMESLDLSRNELSGKISQSLANLNFLNTLDLSYNNLSGEIPTGNQLRTLNSSSYRGNDYLCGSAVNKSCSISEALIGPKTKDSYDSEQVLFYLFVAIGFGLGFWVVCGILILNAKWRYCFFRVVDDGFEMLYGFVVVYIARLMK